MRDINQRGPIGTNQPCDHIPYNTRGPFGGAPNHINSNRLSDIYNSLMAIQPETGTLMPTFSHGLQSTLLAQSSVTPLDFADRYRNTRVSYFTPEGYARSLTVDVHIYNNNGMDTRRGNMQEKSALVSRVRRELRQADGLGLIDIRKEHKGQIARSFYGKGSPDDYAVALTHALRYGRATPNNIQRYCDSIAKLGLDCSGFVNAYLMEIGKVSKQENISTYARRNRRSRPEDIQAGDLLTWADNGHIAIVDHVIANTDPVKLLVVESSNSKCINHTTNAAQTNGLSSSEYTVVSVNDEMFKVNRGSRGSGRGTSNVRIVSV